MMLHQKGGYVGKFKFSRSWIIKKYITGICIPKTGVPQKLRSHIDSNILKKTYFSMRKIYILAMLTELNLIFRYDIAILVSLDFEVHTEKYQQFDALNISR